MKWLREFFKWLGDIFAKLRGGRPCAQNAAQNTPRGNFREVDWLWHHGNSADWQAAIDEYWRSIQPQFRELEHKMNVLNPATLKPMDAKEWFTWLHDEYFVWKFGSNPARLETTRHGRTLRDGRKSASLQSHYQNRPEALLAIKNQILSCDCARIDIGEAIEIGTGIGGLGVAGASGLFALLYPSFFGTVDVFVVQALQKVSDLPEHEAVMRMNGKNRPLSVEDAVLMITIMRRKARENATKFADPSWTPRKIDMVLWVTR